MCVVLSAFTAPGHPIFGPTRFQSPGARPKMDLLDLEYEFFVLTSHVVGHVETGIMAFQCE